MHIVKTDTMASVFVKLGTSLEFLLAFSQTGFWDIWCHLRASGSCYQYAWDPWNLGCMLYISPHLSCNDTQDSWWIGRPVKSVLTAGGGVYFTSSKSHTSSLVDKDIEQKCVSLFLQNRTRFQIFHIFLPNGYQAYRLVLDHCNTISRKIKQQIGFYYILCNLRFTVHVCSLHHTECPKKERNKCMQPVSDTEASFLHQGSEYLMMIPDDDVSHSGTTPAHTYFSPEQSERQHCWAAVFFPAETRMVQPSSKVHFLTPHSVYFFSCSENLLYRRWHLMGVTRNFDKRYGQSCQSDWGVRSQLSASVIPLTEIYLGGDKKPF